MRRSLLGLCVHCPSSTSCVGGAHFSFFSFRQGFIGAPAAVEGNENKQQGSVAAPLPEGGAGLFRIESGWEEGTFFNRTKDKRENRGLWGARPGYLPLAPPGLLPIPLRGSGPRRLSWEGGAEARMDFRWSRDRGRSGREARPRALRIPL